MMGHKNMQMTHALSGGFYASAFDLLLLSDHLKSRLLQVTTTLGPGRIYSVGIAGEQHP